MPVKHNSLNPSGLLQYLGRNDSLYVSEDIAILRSLIPLKTSATVDSLQTPQYVELGRIVLVTGGKAIHHINLVPYETEAGDILVIPQHNYISIGSVSEDYDGQMLSFGHLPIDFESAPGCGFRPTTSSASGTTWISCGRLFTGLMTGRLWSIWKRPFYTI